MRVLAHRILDGYMTRGNIDASHLRKSCRDPSGGVLVRV
jgi:hypothetical protein